MAGKVLTWTNGFPGTISRSIDDVIESIVNGESSASIAFGAPVALVSGAVKNVSADNTAVIGIAVRTIKTEETYGGADPVYKAKEMVDVIKRGSVAIQVSDGSPAAGGTVYIVKATGAFRTSSDSTNTIEMANWKFKGGKDANGVAEIVLTERVY